MIALLLLCIPISAYSVDSDSKNVIKIGFPGEFPPFYFIDENNVIRGASYEIAQHLAKTLNYDIEVHHYPNMQKLLEEVKHGRVDMVINLTGTPQRRKLAFFTRTAHVYETQDLIVRADSNITYNGELSSLSDYYIGTISGWTYGNDFDSSPYLQKVLVNDPDEQLRGLLSGKYDIAINNQQFFLYYAQKLGVANAFKVISPVVYKLPVNIAISHKYPEAKALVNVFEQALQEFIQTEKYQEILNSYGFISKVAEVK